MLGNMRFYIFAVNCRYNCLNLLYFSKLEECVIIKFHIPLSSKFDLGGDGLAVFTKCSVLFRNTYFACVLWSLYLLCKKIDFPSYLSLIRCVEDFFSVLYFRLVYSDKNDVFSALVALISHGFMQKSAQTQ